MFPTAIAEKGRGPYSDSLWLGKRFEKKLTKSDEIARRLRSVAHRTTEEGE